MKRGLVLGGGGLVGMAYHSGVLKALAECGYDVTTSDVVIGTSAGSIIASYMAGAGWSQQDFYEYAHHRHPDVAKDPADDEEAIRQVFEPLWSNKLERVQRSIGSMFALVSSRGHWTRFGRGKVPPSAVRRMFPAGLYSTDRSRQRFIEDLPRQWPQRELYVCGADLYTGERVAFGAPGAPEATLPEAVLASISIPGVFPPVKIGDRQYVDGGAYSATSLDLATEAGCDSIVCIAPLGYRGEGELLLRDPKLWGPVVTRSLFARSLRREVNEARAKGVEVLVIRPWTRDLAAIGSNAMRNFDRPHITDLARKGTLRFIREHEDHPALIAASSARRPA
ncbi:MAG: patatin-like phospholipase family protein [Actinomycetota bacterium]